MEALVITKMAMYCFSVFFLGILGLWWTTENAPNRFIKIFVTTLFCIGTVLAVGTIRNGIEYHIGFYSIAVSSFVLATVFTFAKSNGHLVNTLFKLYCLINMIAVIIFFSI
jgi:hypothetical protein